MAVTPIYGIPYVESSDLVANYPAVSESLAEQVEEKLPTYAATEPATPSVGQIWIDSDDNLGRVWTGSAWILFSVGAADFSDTATGTYTDGSSIAWKYKDYSSSSTLTITRAGFIEVMIQAGGGGGSGASSGAFGGGGGSGGSLSFGTFNNARYAGPLYIPTGTYTITVGAGGAAGTAGGGTGGFASDSRLGEIYAYRGAPGVAGSSGNPFTGGSGGGGASGGSGITGQGNNGAGLSGGQAGGGGGIGGAASGATEGAGLSMDITGTAVTYGSGGSSILTFTTPTIGGGGDGYAGLNLAGQAGGNGRVIVRVRTN
jgi:hypothetical protein